MYRESNIFLLIILFDELLKCIQISTTSTQYLLTFNYMYEYIYVYTCSMYLLNNEISSLQSCKLQTTYIWWLHTGVLVNVRSNSSKLTPLLSPRLPIQLRLDWPGLMEGGCSVGVSPWDSGKWWRNSENNKVVSFLSSDSKALIPFPGHSQKDSSPSWQFDWLLYNYPISYHITPLFKYNRDI